MTAWFRAWFALCAFSSLFLLVTGLCRNILCHKSYRQTRRMKYFYYAAWGLWVAMWFAGIVVRFNEMGIYSCGDDEPRNVTFMSNDDW